jgi:hypothetical protein
MNKLFLVITNFYREDFEESALDLVPSKPICWIHYVDDTFVIGHMDPRS